MDQTEFSRVPFQSLHLTTAYIIRESSPFRRDVVVRHTYYSLRAQKTAATLPYALEGLRTGHFVTVKPVYVELSGTTVDDGHDVTVPNLVEKCVHPLNLFMQSMNASTDAVTMSVSAPKP